ncbi:DegT/DnrJ/EryC1/StrS family aminotransferase, partial [Candidatus Bipolaricaulota bacterium]|nr:DegT/DnrJ/EryC1/StrS family aminotransferase [Candidatus Bipolaricaulota bacterium]
QASPVFADIDPVTLCIDPVAVERAITPNTKAILAVDVFGHPADWDALERIAVDHDLLLIEDSAEALGSTLHGKPCGGFGHAGVFAFYPNKQITTGEGGALVTNDETLASLARSMNDQGRGDGGWLNHVRLGYNYRIDEMSAALGCSQMARLDEVVARLATVAGWYEEALADIPDVATPTVGDGVEMSWFVYVIRLSRHRSRGERDAVLRGLQQKGIGSRDYFQPIHLQPYIRHMLGTRPGQYPITESIADRTIAVPFYSQLSKDDVGRVADALDQLLRQGATR